MATESNVNEEDQCQEEERRSLGEAIITNQRVLAKSREPGSDDAFRLEQIRTNESLLKELGYIS